MSITYERTMTLIYPVELNDTDFAKLSAKLHEKGFSMTSTYHYGSPNDEDYGYVAREKKARKYTVIYDNNTICSFNWDSDAKKVVNGLNRTFGEGSAVVKDESVITNKKKWKAPQGKWVIVRDSLLEGSFVGNTEGVLYKSGEDKVFMVITMKKTNYNGIELVFKVSWVADKVQKKDTIENMMVDIPLKDMGIIRSIVESRLKLKQFGLKDEPTIECHFDAKTESRSECAPDIVARVRNARKG